jgi:hypothetical protein
VYSATRHRKGVLRRYRKGVRSAILIGLPEPAPEQLTHILWQTFSLPVGYGKRPRADMRRSFLVSHFRAGHQENSMAVNIVELVTQSLTPQVISKTASALGINPALAQALAGATIPAVLAALAGVASTPGGAKNIADNVSKQDPDVLNNVVNSIGTSGQGQIVGAGSQILSSLLGSQAVTSLTAALSRFVGANQTAAQTVLGLVTPIAMGTLGQQDPENWSDGNGIARFFASQKDVIAAALPSGLAAALSGSGLLRGIEGSLQGGVSSAAAAANAAGARAAGTASSAASSAANTASQAARDLSASAGGIPSWMLIVGAVVVLALLGWFFLGRSGEKTAVAPATQQSTTTGSVDAADLGKQATAALDGLKTALSSITDADSAKAALPKITDATGKIDGLNGMAGQLSADAKKAFAGQVAPLVTALKDQMDKVAALPGVSDIVKPAFDTLKGKLDALAAG